MAPQELTEYERKRLENIRRNVQVLESLKIHSKANELSSATKRPRVSTKAYVVSPDKKLKPPNPIVIRRSLRTRGKPPPYYEGLKDDVVEWGVQSTDSTVKASPRHMGPLSMKDAYSTTGSDENLIQTILGIAQGSEFGTSVGGAINEIDNCKDDEQVGKLVDLSSLTLKPENIARVVPGRILSVRFFPCRNSTIVVAGNKFGNVGFWNTDSTKEDGNQVYLYRSHSAPISDILIPQYSLSKIFTSCYDGFIRLMDAEKEVFDLAYSSDECIFSLAQKSNDMKSLYFSEGHGGFNIWDERMGKSISKWILHEDRINTIDFNVENPNIMATSSTDGSACIWDLRNIDADKPQSLKMFSHKRAVHSAYFSPSGNCLATTSVDDTLGILRGVNYDEMSTIHHDNKTGRWISSFRGIWGWDDSYIFIGNMKRGADVVSATRRNIVMTLQSPYISAIPCRFDAHPYRIGTLAGATSGGQVYIWTSG